ncbi:MAG: host attachment protein, partial [Candidatus Dadabacteria bacterium]|nr:host attachment protein [Candidatus Dadabacteria bacterium]
GENSRARIFALDNISSPLQELADMQHTESRLHERDLTSDRPGRTFDSRGAGRHAKEPEISTKKHEAVNFAKCIADYINTESETGKF